MSLVAGVLGEIARTWISSVVPIIEDIVSIDNGELCFRVAQKCRQHYRQSGTVTLPLLLLTNKTLSGARLSMLPQSFCAYRAAHVDCRTVRVLQLSKSCFDYG